MERINESLVTFAQESKGILTLEKVNKLTAHEYFDLLAVFKKQNNRSSDARTISPERNR